MYEASKKLISAGQSDHDCDVAKNVRSQSAAVSYLTTDRSPPVGSTGDDNLSVDQTAEDGDDVRLLESTAAGADGDCDVAMSVRSQSAAVSYLTTDGSPPIGSTGDDNLSVDQPAEVGDDVRLLESTAAGADLSLIHI